MCYNKFLTQQQGASMFLLSVLNDGNEWETIVQTFKTEAEADAFYKAELKDIFEDYDIVELRTA